MLLLRLALPALATVAAFAQDVVPLASDRVKVLFENDRVRVLQFNEPVHSKLPMHSHPATVAVGFTADHSKYTFPDGKTKEERSKAGQVDYSKGMTHASESLNDGPSDAIMVELKKPAVGAPKSAADPVKLDPKHYKVVLDNSDVRVLRAKYGPHEKSVMHEHPDAVAVFMTDGHMKMNLPDSSSQVSDGKAHEAIFTPAGKHLPENLGDKITEVLVIELK